MDSSDRLRFGMDYRSLLIEREAGVCDESRCQNKGASDESRPIFSKGDGLGLSSFVAIATTAVVVARWGFWSLDNLWSVLRRTFIIAFLRKGPAGQPRCDHRHNQKCQ